MQADKNGKLNDEEYVAEIVKLAAKAGADAAIEHINQQKKREKKERVDRRLHNTKLLLRHYKSFKNHIENAVFEEIEDARDTLEEIEELMWEPSVTSDMIVESILKNLARTKIIVEHTERMINCYRDMCKSDPVHIRHFNVIYDMYISEHEYTPAEVAEKYHIDKRTIYKDVNAACKTLSMLLFGIDGIG